MKQYVKVMGRLADPKRRQKESEAMGYGEDPDYWNFYAGFPVDFYGFSGAFEAAEQYVEREVFKHGDTFEWKLSGGEW